MPEQTKCNKKKCDSSSTSSTESSEACYKVKCSPKCDKPECCAKDCPKLKPEEIVCKYANAVVDVHSEFILVGASGPQSGQVNGSTPLAANSRADISLEGNGFFIKGHYIVTPAHLVLLPPSLTSVAARYPSFQAGAAPSFGQIQNQMIRASRILVSVFNVNGKGHSFVYEADLIGVDGAGDLALLKINGKRQFNLCNPCIEKCHPFLKFGRSRASCNGEKVYLLGDFTGSASRGNDAAPAISAGHLADYRHLDHAGWILPETVLVSAAAYARSSGMPILNAQGEVIGMQTTDLAGHLPIISVPEAAITGTVTSTGVVSGTGAVSGAVATIALPVAVTGAFASADAVALNQALGFGFVSGPSQFFMMQVIKALIKGTCSRKYNCQLQVICDQIGSYYRYLKAYAGIAYDVFTGPKYDYTVDFTSGALPLGAPRVRLTSLGEFLTLPDCKQIIGIRVLGLAGANPEGDSGVANGYYYVPGGTATAPLPDGLPVSPFLGRLLPGDVITHIGKAAIGDLKDQIAPSLITWRLCPGDQLQVSFRRGGNASNTTNNSLTENYNGRYEFNACLTTFPELMDYPWYAVQAFPLLAEQPYPGFVFPAGQLTNPQVPGLIDGAIFHPAF